MPKEYLLFNCVTNTPHGFWETYDEAEEEGKRLAVQNVQKMKVLKAVADIEHTTTAEVKRFKSE